MPYNQSCARLAGLRYSHCQIASANQSHVTLTQNRMQRGMPMPSPIAPELECHEKEKSPCSSLVFINIFQFFNYYRLSILGQSNALRSMSPCLYYHSRAIHFSGLGIDPRTVQGISYLVTVSYASTSLPSFCSSSVAFITISKSSSRSPAASSGYASPRLL